MDVTSVIGDFRRFYSDVVRQSAARGIDVTGLPVSHLGYKTRTFDEYQEIRDSLSLVCSGSVENEHNGRPIAKMVLDRPIQLSRNATVSLIEVMAPKRQVEGWPSRLGLEHVGFVVGESLEEFVNAHEEVLTGRQDQGPYCQPAYMTFPDGSRAKFYEVSLRRVVELEGGNFISLK